MEDFICQPKEFIILWAKGMYRWSSEILSSLLKNNLKCIYPTVKISFFMMNLKYPLNIERIVLVEARVYTGIILETCPGTVFHSF